MTASNERILSRTDSCSKVILLMVDDIGSGRRCHNRPSIYFFATYEGGSALAHTRQTQTDGVTC